NVPALTHHWLVLFVRPPQELDLRYEGVKRHVPPPAGAISLLPAGSPHSVRLSGGYKDHLHVYLEPGLVAQVAAEAFDLDPRRLRGSSPCIGRGWRPRRWPAWTCPTFGRQWRRWAPSWRAAAPGDRWPPSRWPTSWPSTCSGTSRRPASWSTGGTARCRGGG